MSAGGDVSHASGAPRIAATGCLVIDNSSAFRYDIDVPLIVPEVNAGRRSSGYTKKNIIANPNCSTAQLVVALKPLHDAANDHTRGRIDLPVGLRRRQRGPWTSSGTRQRASSSPTRRTPKKFTKQIAFNVIPHIDVFMEDGSCKEEWKMVAETKKMLDPARSS